MTEKSCRNCALWSKPNIKGYGECERMSKFWGRPMRVYGGTGGKIYTTYDNGSWTSLPNECFVARKNEKTIDDK